MKTLSSNPPTFGAFAEDVVQAEHKLAHPVYRDAIAKSSEVGDASVMTKEREYRAGAAQVSRFPEQPKS